MLYLLYRWKQYHPHSTTNSLSELMSRWLHVPLHRLLQVRCNQYKMEWSLWYRESGEPCDVGFYQQCSRECSYTVVHRQTVANDTLRLDWTTIQRGIHTCRKTKYRNLGNLAYTCRPNYRLVDMCMLVQRQHIKWIDTCTLVQGQHIKW